MNLEKLKEGSLWKCKIHSFTYRMGDENRIGLVIRKRPKEIMIAKILEVDVLHMKLKIEFNITHPMNCVVDKGEAEADLEVFMKYFKQVKEIKQ